LYKGIAIACQDLFRNFPQDSGANPHFSTKSCVQRLARDSSPAGSCNHSTRGRQKQGARDLKVEIRNQKQILAVAFQLSGPGFHAEHSLPFRTQKAFAVS
jgi:hypothetical protein